MKVCVVHTNSVCVNIRRPWRWRSKWKKQDNSSVSGLNRLLQRLCDADIDFVIVGGFAAVLHGSALLTRDLNVCTVLTAENIGKLREVCYELHPTHRFSSERLSFLQNPESDKDIKNLYLQTDLGPIDFLSSIDGVGSFEQVRAESIEIDLFGRIVRVKGIARDT
jgi:hypothetical protein